MRWKLDIPFSPSFNIGYGDDILMMGSCFTENIGHFLNEYKFRPIINPFGILYNPISIAEGLKRLVLKQDFQEEELFFHNELYHSWSHHGRFSDTSKEKTLSKINTEFHSAKNKIENLDVLILTLGSAFVYQKNDTSQTVANCHKLPNSTFKKRMLSVNEITMSLKYILRILLEKNPRLKIILTVSPVRHIRDGIIENNRSKASLLLAVEELERGFENIIYFPSYEILMDELRDYRFYSSDLVHPSHDAIQYIWDKFSAAFLDNENLEVLAKVQSIVKGLNHRPLHEETASHKKFQKNLKKKIERIEEEYPFIQF